MNIAIVGLGKFGNELVKTLSTEKHNIMVVDTSSQVVDDVVNEYDIQGYVGNGASYETLKEISIEKYDGTGYCFGLKGEEIPLFARIISVDDEYDATNSSRCHRKALDIDIIMG